MALLPGPLTGKCAMVTGASRGIGRAIALRLAQMGAQVAVNYARSEAAARQVVLEIEQSGGAAGLLQADLAETAQIGPMFDAFERNFGPLDILVNNAGIAIFKPVAETSLEDFQSTFDLNTRGAFLCLRESARRMRDGGRIVNISTGATVGGTAGGAIYCGSKAALEQFTRALARELAPRAITVNTVSPGFTETEMLAQFPGLVESAPKLTPLGRVGQPADIANVVGFLCSPEGAWLTGQNLQASGGLNMV